jgi:hypothetical protein
LIEAPHRRKEKHAPPRDPLLYDNIVSGGERYAESPTVVAVAGPPALQLSSFDLAPLGYRTDEFFVLVANSKIGLNSGIFLDLDTMPACTTSSSFAFMRSSPSAGL